MALRTRGQINGLVCEGTPVLTNRGTGGAECLHNFHRETAIYA